MSKKFIWIDKVIIEVTIPSNKIFNEPRIKLK